MQYEWDEQKAASNFRKHKLTFEDGVAVFDDPAHVIIEASRERDREVRSKAIGTFKGAVYVVVFNSRQSAPDYLRSPRQCEGEEGLWSSLEGPPPMRASIA